jgi:hypothetical protein
VTDPQAATLSSIIRRLVSPFDANDGLNAAHGHRDHWDHSREVPDGMNDVPGGFFLLYGS